MQTWQVCVVGAGNSAGQAAVHLAKYAARVLLLVRSESLGASMSDYLVAALAFSTPADWSNLDAKVLLIGAGGLGSPTALYLAASGVGTIGLVDDDVVEESNLQRQVLHGVDRLGMRKVDSAELTIRGLNPDTNVVKHAERLGPDNVERLIAGYDVIVDGTDNFDTRYVLNDAAVKLRKPVVHGSIYRWDGQVTTFVPFEGPCYRCMYPTQPPAELAPACSVAGVLGVLPGIVGLMQANEVFKLLLGVGETLAGRLLMFDAMGTTFDEVRTWRDPSCPACGEGVEAQPAAPASGVTA